jgi:putative protein-disulfide isomerase
MLNPMPSKTITLYYFHDPMCSWCWGYRPVWQQLKSALPIQMNVQNKLAGLAPDTEEVMPLQLQARIQNYWQEIESLLGTDFNFDFWRNNQPRRATYKACRAVLAATNQGHEEAMIEAIQQAYYLRALNPSDSDVLVQLANELGLNVSQFTEDLEAELTHQQLDHQVAFTRAAPIAGFPALLLQVRDELHTIAVDYKDYRPTLAEITALLNTEV